MKVAIDVSPLSSGHKVRGVGFYLQNLKEALLKYHSQHSYVFFDDFKDIPPDVDLVHFPYFEPFKLSLPLKNKYKTVVTVHDLIPIVFKKHFPSGVKGSLRWQIQKRSLSSVDAIITDSNSSKSDIRKTLEIDPNKIFVTYLAASSDFYRLSDPRKAEAIFEKYAVPKKFILYVGDVTWNKNLVRIVEAVKKTKFNLVLVGKAVANKDYDRKNPWNKDLVGVSELIEGDERFFAVGFVSNEDLNFLYNKASFLLIPSIYEGFGLPVLEAMQSGCPVVTSQEGSLKEVAGDAAFFVDPFSVDSISRAVSKLMEDMKLKEELVKKGLKRAKEFSWEKTAGETIRIYERVDAQS